MRVYSRSTILFCAFWKKKKKALASICTHLFPLIRIHGAHTHERKREKRRKKKSNSSLNIYQAIFACSFLPCDCIPMNNSNGWTQFTDFTKYNSPQVFGSAESVVIRGTQWEKESLLKFNELPTTCTDIAYIYSFQPPLPLFPRHPLRYFL